MLHKVQRKMEELNMVSLQDTILVGVSGGADSVCLLMVLVELRKDMGFSLEAVHVEHGIRGQESVADADYVEDLCARMQVPCTRVSVDVPRFASEHGVGTEEAARLLRYEVFARLAQEKGAKVALAHHMEDNAETMLFQLVRGSSLTGLCGMQPIRTDEDGVVYIRPLLSLHRAELEQYLTARGVGWRTDSTNEEVEYSRNFLRKMVVPQLAKLNEQAVAHMNKTAEDLREVRDFLEQETDRAWACCAQTAARGVADGDGVQDPSLESREVRIDIEGLTQFHPAIQKELILRAIVFVAGSRKDIGTIHVEDVRKLCNRQSGKEVHLPYGVAAKREFGKIRVACKDDGESECSTERTISPKELEEIAFSKEALVIPLRGNGERICLRVFSYDGKSDEIPKKSYTKWLDYDKIKQGFCIRTRKAGDYFVSDAAGHHKKLKDYFVDEKIPSDKREQMWLVAQDSLVLWLVGGRISEHVKVDEYTKQIIELEYQGG